MKYLIGRLMKTCIEVPRITNSVCDEKREGETSRKKEVEREDCEVVYKAKTEGSSHGMTEERLLAALIEAPQYRFYAAVARGRSYGVYTSWKRWRADSNLSEIAMMFVVRNSNQPLRSR